MHKIHEELTWAYDREDWTAPWLIEGERASVRLTPFHERVARTNLLVVAGETLTSLSAVSEAEFATPRALLEVSDSVLSKHISALADAGYVRSRKGVRAGLRTTWVELTKDGQAALRDHVRALRALIDMVD